MQDVPGFLGRKGMTYACYMDPSEPAVIDATHAVRVNYECFLFADTAARELFRDDFVRFCGLLTDPVTKRRFRPEDDSPRHEFEGVTYFFESIRAYEMFLDAPEEYRLPGFTM